MDIIINSPQSSIAFYLFDYPIRYYGVIMCVAFFVGILLSYHLFKIKYLKSQADILLDYSPLVIFFSIIGARFFYVVGSLEFYLKNPLEIIMINHGGLSIFGAITFGLVSLFYFSKKYKFDCLKHCDVLAVVFPFCQSIGRFGNYFNQEAFGKPSNLFIKLFVDEINRPIGFENYQYFHPAFLYESILNLITFIFLLYLYLKKKYSSGTIFLLYLLIYSTVRFFIEGIRLDSALNIGTIPIVQIICVVLFLISIFALILRYKKRTF